MSAVVVFLLSWAAFVASVGTPIGCSLQRAMVELPAAAIGSLRRVDVAAVIVVVGMIILHLNAGDADPARLLGLFAPKLALWLAGLEFGALLESAAALMGLAAAGRPGLRGLATMLGCGRRPESMMGRARCSRRFTRARAANDNEDGAALAQAG